MVRWTRLPTASRDDQWLADDTRLEVLRVELERLQVLCWELPSYLHERIHDFADEVRSAVPGDHRHYLGHDGFGRRAAGAVSGLFYAWVFRPLECWSPARGAWLAASLAIASSWKPTTKWPNWPRP